jgi:hypothetical protein
MTNCLQQHYHRHKLSLFLFVLYQGTGQRFAGDHLTQQPEGKRLKIGVFAGQLKMLQ